MLRLLYILAVVYAVSACGDASTEHNHDHDHAGHSHDHGDHEGHDHGDHEGHDHGTETTAAGLGDKVNPQGAMSTDQVVAKIESGDGTVEYDLGEGQMIQAVPTKVEGTVAEVCQAQGCWLTVKTSDGTELFVDTKHKFLFPKDIAGKTVVISGNAYKSVQSVEELRNEAKEAEKTAEEIEAITEPLSSYTLVADGAVIK